MFFRSVLATYIQESRFAIEKYNALSMINGLPYDRHAEIVASELFLEALQTGMNDFVSDPVGVPMLSAWIRVRSAVPEFLKNITEAVEVDND